MKKILPLLIAGVFAMSLTGCAQNKTRVAEGAGLGALLGAAAGGIIGHQSGHGMEGALIGGAVGAGGGALAGSQMNKPQAQTTATTGTTTTTTTTVPVTGPITMQQIIDWSREGVSNDDIVMRIRNSHSTYALTVDDINYLRAHGVAQRVIDEMLAAK
jgi:uncharacterized protein YcfJ